MRKILLTAVLANGAALALLLAACKAPDGAGSVSNTAPPPTTNAPAANTAPAPPTKPPADVVRRVTPKELKAMMDKGEAVVVDVRSKDSFAQERVKGSILIPRGETAARAAELPKDKLIVFYCA